MLCQKSQVSSGHIGSSHTQSWQGRLGKYSTFPEWLACCADSYPMWKANSNMINNSWKISKVS